MGKGGDLDKVALVLIALAFQLHAFCMATKGQFTIPSSDQDQEAADDAIKAFLITAFIVYTCAFILAVLINFGGLNGKIAKFITVAACFVGVACTVIGLSVYGAELDELNVQADVNAFSITTYVIGLSSLGVGGVLMLLAMCC